MARLRVKSWRTDSGDHAFHARARSSMRTSNNERNNPEASPSRFVKGIYLENWNFDNWTRPTRTLEIVSSSAIRAMADPWPSSMPASSVIGEIAFPGSQATALILFSSKTLIVRPTSDEFEIRRNTLSTMFRNR